MTAADDHDPRVAEAARTYLVARVALMGADSGAMLARTVELDAAFHELVRACGFSCEDVGCWHEHTTEGDGDG